MAVEYPDVIGEYIPATQRYEVSGLQYVGVFEPPTIKAGETTQFHLYLQSIINAPLKVMVKIGLPQSGRFRGQPVLQAPKTEFEVELKQAEVGRLVVPMVTTEKVVEGSFSLDVEVKTHHERGANRIRSPKQEAISVPYLDSLIGLDLIGVLGTNYNTKNGRKANFTVNLSKELGEPGELPNLESEYQQIWDMEIAELMHKAQNDINERRAKIIDELKIEPLFTALYAENTERFADAGLPLRIGEAIAIGKLLTFTVHLFLGRNSLQNSLLCPIWERALANEYTTANALSVLKYAGYKHILRLAIALSFGMVAETVGQHLWSQRERQEVTSFIADALDQGINIPPDFLYLPLMMGAMKVVTRVQLPDEDLRNTVQLIQKGYQARPEILTDEDMIQANQVFNHLLKQTMESVKA